tara:strand:- start:42172 stop:43419 length:1248 start_codon:yes stop_codon:yes gene_type:complete
MQMSKFDAIRADIADIQKKHRARPEMMHGVKLPYYRRGEMAIPAFRMKAGGDVETDGRAQSLKVMNKAAQMPIDFFFYDLEDAAPDNPEYKQFARKFIVEALNTNDYGKRIVAFRPNNIRTPYFEDDIVEVVSAVGDKLDAMVIPKTEYAEEVADIIKIVKDVQRLSGHTNKIWMEILFESPRAFLEVEKIAALDDVASLIFGSWDFARTIGGKVTAEGWLEDQAWARQILPIVAAAYGKDAVDAVTATLPLRPKKPESVSVEEYKAALALSSDQIDTAVFGEDFIASMKKKERALELVRRDAMNARAIGFAAKWILHPDQIEPVHSAWTPSRQEALAALDLAASYAKAARSGSGAEVDDDRLADKAVVGTDWWIVQAGIRSEILTDEDIKATGLTFQELLRAVVNHDEHIHLQE